MPPQPLTHHEIIGLVEPFARSGRQLDLAASNRLERQLVFKPTARTDAAPGLSGLRETLRLENPRRDTFRLTRVLALDGGLEASLEGEGPQPGELLARIDAVPAAQQIRYGPGFVMALTHEIDAGEGTAPAEASSPRLVLTRAEAHLDGLTVKVRVPTMRGIAADIELVVMTADSLELPEDLLAVLGWDWARLRRTTQGWNTKLRLRGREPERSRRIERKLERTAQHLARTLAEPPGRFHERWLRARWGVVFRRAIPLLTFAGLLVAVLAMPPVAITQVSEMWVLMFHAPLLLIAISLSVQEMSQVEIPPLPRRSAASAWWAQGVAMPERRR